MTHNPECEYQEFLVRRDVNEKFAPPCTCPDLATQITQLASEYAEHKHLDKESFYSAVNKLLQ